MPKHLSSLLPIAFLSGLFLLTACGQKGPLYLPEKDTKKQQTEQKTSQNYRPGAIFSLRVAQYPHLLRKS